MQKIKCNYIIYLTLIGIFLLGCNKGKNENAATDKSFIDYFTNGKDGWVGDFADYPNEADTLSKYQFEFSHSGLPNPLNNADGALKLSGINRSDDLFMFIKKKVSGLVPGKIYSIDFKVDFATNADSNMLGVGGAPGEGVTIKVGAVPLEPMKFLHLPENWFRMNIDKGNQSVGGADMKIIGDFANGTSQNIYLLKQLSTTTPINVKANQQGDIWLVIGTDSGFEGITTIFYNSIQIIIK